MSTLIVVRHGQASFLADNYDQLSELGWEQARRLGEYWAQHEIHPTALVVGPRQRHRETAEAVTGALLAAGVDLPDIVPDDRLDEFDWDGLMMYANSTLAEREPDVADLRDRFHNSEDLSVKRRTIQHYMESVMHHWVSATFHEEGLETWAEFRHRVETALHLHTADTPRGSRIVFLTSGGVAATLAGQVLELSAEKTVGLIWTLRNGALVEFLYNQDQISLSAFNNAPHLPSKDLWTYR